MGKQYLSSVLMFLLIGISWSGFGIRSVWAVTPVWQNIDIAGVSNDFNNPTNNYGYNTVVVDQTNSTTVFVGTNYQGIYKSTNSGASWTKIDTGAGSNMVDGGRIWSLVMDPFNHTILYAASGYGYGGPLKSTDGGVSWINTLPSTSSVEQTLGTNDIYGVAVDPYTPNHLLASFHYYWLPGTSDSGVIESFDGGTTWTIHYAPSGSGWGAGNSVWFLNNSTTWLLGSQNAGYWRTTNSGNSWTQVSTNNLDHGGVYDLYRDTSTGVLFAGYFGGIMKSTDNGASWIPFSTGLPGAAFETVMSDGANLYTAPSFPTNGDNGQAHGPWYTVSLNGSTWSAYNSQQTCDISNNVCNGPMMMARDATNNIIYSVNWLGGLWRLTANQIANTPSPTPSLIPSPTPGQGSGNIFGLHVSGNKILNSQNQPVKLVGVDRAGTEYMCLSGGANVFDGPSDLASIQSIAAWHANIVRLPINEDCWLGINGEPNSMTATAYQQAIINYVSLLNQNGIAAIIDLQWAAPGTTVSNQLTPMPDLDHAPAFWQSAANTFKNNSSVLFDLYNEPFPDNNSDTTSAWTCLLQGGTCSGVSYQAAGMQTLVTTIRNAGANNVIMVPGVQYTNILDNWLIYKPTDPQNNLSASWHSYANQICNNSTCWNGQIAQVMQQVPLVAGEIGENDCQDIYINPLMSWLDTKSGNYLAWAWNMYDCSSFPSVISDYTGTPTGFGIGYEQHLFSLAGAPTPTPQPIPMFTTTFPFGINVGSTQQYTANDGTIYYPDVNATGITVDSTTYGFNTYTTSDTISGTDDPGLFKKGRSGVSGIWTINVPNGTYNVTLSAAQTNSFSMGQFGQDQNLQGQKVGTCVWSNNSGPSGCPQQVVSVPPIDQVQTVTYTVSVFNQQLQIQPAASFGGGRTTILDMIRVAQSGSTLKTGDANGDGKVNTFDFAAWAQNDNKPLSGMANGDFDGSGFVDGKDLSVWIANYGM